MVGWNLRWRRMDNGAVKAVQACDLGETFDFAIRCTVFVTCVFALVLKKYFETSGERKWDDFLLDASKQFFGLFYAQVFFGSSLCEGGPGGNCAEQFVRMAVGATFGTFIQLLLLNVMVSFTEGAFGDTGDLTTGEYRDLSGVYVPDKYGKQLLAWLVCVTVACLLKEWLVAEFRGIWMAASACVLSLISWSPGMQLAFVSVLMPCCLACIQLWVTDEFLRLGGLPVLEVIAAAAPSLVQTESTQVADKANFAHGAREHLLGCLSSDGSTLPFWDPTNFRTSRNLNADDNFSTACPRAFATSASAGVAPPARHDCSRGLGLKLPAVANGGWFGSSASPSPAIESPVQTCLHPELQYALEGMENQVAKAMGCVPANRLESEVIAAMAANPVSERLAQNICVEPQNSELEVSNQTLESQELEELKARIGEKDKFLQRLRDEIARTEGRRPGSPRNGRSRSVEIDPSTPLRGTSPRQRMGDFAEKHDFENKNFEVPRKSPTRKSKYQVPTVSGKAKNAKSIDKPFAEAREDVPANRSRTPEPWQPAARSAAKVDGRIAALAAKIHNLQRM